MREVYEIENSKGSYFIYIDDILVAGRAINSWNGDLDENRSPANITEVPMVMAKVGYVVEFHNRHRFFMYCVSDVFNHSELRPKFRLAGYLIDDSVYQSLKEAISFYIPSAIYEDASFTHGFDLDIEYSGGFDSIVKFRDHSVVDLESYEYMEIPILSKNMIEKLSEALRKDKE